MADDLAYLVNPPVGDDGEIDDEYREECARQVESYFERLDKDKNGQAAVWVTCDDLAQGRHWGSNPRRRGTATGTVNDEDPKAAKFRAIFNETATFKATFAALDR